MLTSRGRSTLAPARSGIVEGDRGDAEPSPISLNTARPSATRRSRGTLRRVGVARRRSSRPHSARSGRALRVLSDRDDDSPLEPMSGSGAGIWCRAETSTIDYPSATGTAGRRWSAQNRDRRRFSASRWKVPRPVAAPWSGFADLARAEDLGEDPRFGGLMCSTAVHVSGRPVVPRAPRPVRCVSRRRSPRSRKLGARRRPDAWFRELSAWGHPLTGRAPTVSGRRAGVRQGRRPAHAAIVCVAVREPIRERERHAPLGGRRRPADQPASACPRSRSTSD